MVPVCFPLLKPITTLRSSLVLLLLPASWDQSRTGQDSYVLMASSQAEMEEWVKFLRRVAGTPSGGKDSCRLRGAEVCNISAMGWRQLQTWFFLEQFSEETTRGQLWGHAHCQASNFPPWAISAGIRDPPVNSESGAGRQFCDLWPA